MDEAGSLTLRCKPYGSLIRNVLSAPAATKQHAGGVQKVAGWALARGGEFDRWWQQRAEGV